MATGNPYVDQYAVPRVTVNVGGKLVSGLVVGGTDIDDVLDYSYTSDILSLTDTAAINVANPSGKYSKTVTKGSRLYVSMADPNVNGGAKVLRLSGLVVNPRMLSRGGEKIQLVGADQGWYLERCDAPLWMNLETSRSLETFLNRMLRGPKGEDYGWGFYDEFGVLKLSADSLSNDALFTRLNQGRAGLERSATIAAIKGHGPGAANDPLIPPLQVEPGTKIGQLIIDYCRRAKLLVNVTSLGALQLFKPDYAQGVSYRVDYHDDAQRNKQNGVLDVTVDDSVDGIATDVLCVSQNAWFKGVITKDNPNVDKLKKRYLKPSAAPHYMRMAFGDNEQLTVTAVGNRAQWAQQRGEFDAFQMQVELFGHAQGGVFFVPNTMWAVNDSVHNVVGNLYCSACRYVRDRGGTRTIVTLRKPGLLAA